MHFRVTCPILTNFGSGVTVSNLQTHLPVLNFKGKPSTNSVKKHSHASYKSVSILPHSRIQSRSTTHIACDYIIISFYFCQVLLLLDHIFDHLGLWITWKMWTLWHEKARVSDEKARKSTQNEAKNRCFCVWDVDAAGSNPVTPTKNIYGVQCPIDVFRLNLTMKNLSNRLRFDRVCGRAKRRANAKEYRKHRF